MRTISVLLVDDNLTFLTIATQFLQRCEGIISVAAASEEEEALEKAGTTQPDVVIVDFHMPRLAPSRLIARLHAALPQVRIVAVTVPDVNEYRHSSLAEGVDAFVSRSTLRIDLVPTIWRVVELGSQAEVSPGPITARRGVEHSRRVLVMEDERDLRRFYSKALRRAGYDVRAAATVDEARQLLRQYRFDAFLCDIHMGDNRGTDLLREQLDVLRRKGTQVIMVSGQAQYRSLCEEMGTEFFVIKPISVGPLITLVDRLTASRDVV
jgi:CheY-like chemotaxis protein